MEVNFNPINKQYKYFPPRIICPITNINTDDNLQIPGSPKSARQQNSAPSEMKVMRVWLANVLWPDQTNYQVFS